MRKADELNLSKVSISEQSHVKEYFLGKKQESDMIDISRRAYTLLNKDEIKMKTQRGLIHPKMFEDA